jgi:hypothetical protein
MNLCKARQACAIVAGLLLMALLARTSYGQKPAGQDAPAQPAPSKASPPSAAPNKVVLKVENEEVTQADLDMALENLTPQQKKTMESEGRRPVGDQYALMVLLSQRALNDHLDTSPDFVRRFAMERRQWLAQAEYRRLFDQTKGTPEEVNQYYSAHPNDFIVAEVRQIIIRRRPESVKEASLGMLEQEARTRMEEIRKAILAGTDPKKVADQFAVQNVVFIDVAPRNVNRPDLNPDMEKQVFQLKDGALTDVFNVPQALVCFQVLRQRRLELKELGSQVENLVHQQKIQALMADLKKKANIWMDDAYFAPPPPKPAAPAPNTPSSTPPAKP